MSAKESKSDEDTWLTPALEKKLKGMRVMAVDIESFGSKRDPKKNVHPPTPAWGWACVDGLGNPVEGPVTKGLYFPGDEKDALGLTLGDFWKGEKFMIEDSWEDDKGKHENEKVTMLDYCKRHWNCSNKYKSKATAEMEALEELHAFIKRHDRFGDEDKSKHGDWYPGEFHSVMVTDCPGFDLTELRVKAHQYGMDTDPGYHINFWRTESPEKVNGKWRMDFRGVETIHSKRMYLENPPKTMPPCPYANNHDPGCDAYAVAWSFVAAMHSALEMKHWLIQQGHPERAKRIGFALRG